MSGWKSSCDSPYASWPAGEPRARREVLADLVGAGGSAAAPPTSRRSAKTAVVALPAEEVEEAGLRPRTLDEFVGQAQLVEHLGIVLEAARGRSQPADHLLFAGPPGLGKTSLAGIVAAEMGVGLRVTSGPVLARAGDLAALLTDLQEGDVLFIDEIHRLHRSVEEVLYPAMEDAKLDIVIGKDRRRAPSASTCRTSPLWAPPPAGAWWRGHCGTASASSGDSTSMSLSSCGPSSSGPPGSSGSPWTGRGRRASRTFAGHAAHREPPAAPGPGLRRGPRRRGDHRRAAVEGLELFGVDELGLDKVDRAILDALCRRFSGSPVGSPRSPSASVRRPTRSRTPTSPTCSSRAAPAHPRGGWRRRVPGRIGPRAAEPPLF